MVTSQLPLKIVSFASGSVRDELQGALQRLRLNRPVCTVSGNDWLAQRAASRDEHIILALGSASGAHYPRSQVLASLQRQQLVPALAVVADPNLSWDAELLDHCSEFAHWPCQLEELSLRLSRGCREPAFATEDQNGPLEEFANLNLIGQSPAFLQMLGLVKKLVNCEAPVLIEGETGTGKELVAQAIHYLGARRDYPFLPVNCGAMPDQLFENELFGHERGAYTDAKETQSGLVAQAQKGTLFLDEVESLSAKAQAALLRFLQNQEYKPLGGGMVKHSNVRIIAATNSDLTALIDRGAFREDLFFRLNVMMVAVPPLRERPGDIDLLADYFLGQYNTHYRQAKKAFHPAALAWMRSYRWPGNVRELESFVHRALLLSDTALVHLPATRILSEEIRPAV